MPSCSTMRLPIRSASSRWTSSKQQVRERVSHEHFFASRQKVKRKLLDQLDKLHKFEAPPSLVEQEFQGIWQSIEKTWKSAA